VPNRLITLFSDSMGNAVLIFQLSGVLNEIALLDR
jgi:hypothetical protein